jgi:hypothetical protein
MTEKLLKRGRPSVRYAVRPDFAEPKKKKSADCFVEGLLRVAFSRAVVVVHVNLRNVVFLARLLFLLLGALRAFLLVAASFVTPLCSGLGC